MALVVAVAIGVTWFIVTRPAAIRRGVDLRIAEIRMPLYLKLLAYVHRDLEFRNLSRKLVGGIQDREAKILALFEWVRKHVRPIPEGLPAIDDHV